MTSPALKPASETDDPDLPLRAEVLDGYQEFAGLRQEWQALFDSVDGAGWSCNPEVFHTWTQVLRQGGKALIISVRDTAGKLRGLMPLMQDLAWRGPAAAPRFDYDPRDRGLIANRRVRPIPVRQITTMGSLPATMLWVGPLCQPQDTEGVCHAIAGTILKLPGWDVAILPAIEGVEDLLWSRAFAEQGVSARIQTLGRVVQDIQRLVPFQQIVDRQKKKFRQNVRRAHAAAQEAGVRFEFHSGQAAVKAMFGTVERLASASWKHEGRDGTEVHIAYHGNQQAFFERLLASKGLTAEPVLGVALDADGSLAVLLMLRHGITLTALLTFWDGRQPAASPGLLLLGAAIDWAVAQGATRFDFNATAPWVRYLVDVERTVCHVMVFAPTLRGRVLAGIAGLSRRLRGSA